MDGEYPGYVGPVLQYGFPLVVRQPPSKKVAWRRKTRKVRCCGERLMQPGPIQSPYSWPLTYREDART